MTASGVFGTSATSTICLATKRVLLFLEPFGLPPSPFLNRPFSSGIRYSAPTPSLRVREPALSAFLRARWAATRLRMASDPPFGLRPAPGRTPPLPDFFSALIVTGALIVTSDLIVTAAFFARSAFGDCAGQGCVEQCPVPQCRQIGAV